MSDQIFKQQPPVDTLIEFLEGICDFADGMFVFTNESYRRAILLGVLEPFLTEIAPYYHNSKRTYALRKMSFARLATVVRQICRSHELSYTSKIVYGNSSYHIRYFIVAPPKQDSPSCEK